MDVHSLPTGGAASGQLTGINTTTNLWLLLGAGKAPASNPDQREDAYRLRDYSNLDTNAASSEYDITIYIFEHAYTYSIIHS